MYLLYLLFLLFFLFIFFIYIKLKIGFWAVQPVFHIYDFQYYLYKPFIINKKLDSKFATNKYVNKTNVITTNFLELKNNDTAFFTFFIQKNYLQNNENKYNPKKENILPYFIGHNKPCWISFYLYSTYDNLLKKSTHKIATITSRPLSVVSKNNDTFLTYYVDYLCVKPDYRNRGIAPQLIQTHYVNQMNNCPQIPTCLFKKEGDLTCIVPLCVFNTYGYDINKFKKPFKNKNSKTIENSKNKLNETFEFIKKNIKKHEITILPEIGNLFELIKTNNLHTFININFNNEITSCYIYRNMCVNIDNDTNVVSLIGSITTEKNLNNFIDGFLYTIELLKNKNYNYKMVGIEDISFNTEIIKYLLKNNIIANIKNSTAYFFYNYVHPTMSSNKVLIIT